MGVIMSNRHPSDLAGGLYVHAGSRFETSANLGAAHMAALMGFRSTAHLSHLRQGALGALGAGSNLGFQVLSQLLWKGLLAGAQSRSLVRCRMFCIQGPQY